MQFLGLTNKQNSGVHKYLRLSSTILLKNQAEIQNESGFSYQVTLFKRG